MLEHYSKNYPHPYAVFPNDKFISICIPTYCRPFYLTKLLDTLAQYADMYYEVIVCDDGSPQELREEVFKMSDKISVLAFNNGHNAGLNVAANRVISLASSRYILFLNDDCFFTGKCLKNICNVLSKPYVGLITPMNNIGNLLDAEGVCNVNGTRFALSSFLGGSSVIGFRKEVWREVGGWDTRNTSGQSDNVFCYKILKAGYWKAVMEGHDTVKVGNFVYGADYKPTQPYSKGNDCSFPKIFGISENELIYLNHKHREACQFWVDGERTIPNRETFYDDRPNPTAGLNDIPYWGTYLQDIFSGKQSWNMKEINWQIAERHGQAKWKDKIEKDFGLK